MIVSKTYAKLKGFEDMDSEMKPTSYIKLKGNHKGILCVIPHCFDKKKEPIVDMEDVFGDATRAIDRHSFQLIPNLLGLKNDFIRDIIYVIGQSGSGKTYYAGQYATEYRKAFPDRKIIYISPQKLKKTDILMKFNPLIADCVGENAHKNWVDEETKFAIPYGEDKKGKEIKSEFDNCLVAIDDLEGINDKKVKKGLDDFISQILHTGRHRNISVIFLKHEACCGRETKTILNECHYLTLMLKGVKGGKIDYLLKTYVGLTKEQIDYVKKLHTRYVTFSLNYPSFLMTENEIKILA